MSMFLFASESMYIQNTKRNQHDKCASSAPSHEGIVEEEHREKSAEKVGNKIEAWQRLADKN